MFFQTDSSGNQIDSEKKYPSEIFLQPAFSDSDNFWAAFKFNAILKRRTL